MIEYGLDYWGLIPGRGRELFVTASRPALGSIHPPIQCVPGALSPGIKQRQGREADHSSPCSADAKNTWFHISTSQYTFKVWCSVKAEG
jgi:hypothetical protein